MNLRQDKFRALSDEVQKLALTMLEPILGLVAGEVVPERASQDMQWGGPAHDDTHTPDDWMSYIGKQMHKIQTARDPDAVRDGLVKVVSLGIAAIQSHDRLNPPSVKMNECECAGCRLERHLEAMRASGADVHVIRIDGDTTDVEGLLGAILSGGMSLRGFQSR